MSGQDQTNAQATPVALGIGRSRTLFDPKPIPLGVDRHAQQEALHPRVDLTKPRPFRALFVVPLDGDQLVTSPEHLGVAYVVSVLRHAGAVCRIVEVPVGEPVEPVLDALEDWGPDVIGITLSTVSGAHALHFGEQLRSRVGGDVFVLAGGPLATFRGRSLMATPPWAFLDGLVRGEGEVPMLRLAEALHAKTALTQVPNLVFRGPDGDLVETEMEEGVRDLDLLPPPARDQFERRGARLSPRFAFLRLSTSRGCTSFCSFCNAPHARNRVQPTPIWRGCSPERVVDEIEDLHVKYRCTSFSFVDSTFEDPGGTRKAKDRLAAIANLLLARRLPVYYSCCMQALNWTESDHELVDLLWRSGLESVLVGIEAGCDEDLALWRKRSTVADNERVIELLRRHEILVHFGFISFHPYSTFDTIRKNHAFLFRSGVGYNLERFLSRLELYAGAEMAEILRRDGLLLPSYDDRCDEYGYSYVDPRLERLSLTLNSLYGDYNAHYGVARGPWKFEAQDTALHLLFSRLRRRHLFSPGALEILDTHKAAADAIHGEMAAFNEELLARYVAAVEDDALDQLDIRSDSESLLGYVEQSADRLRRTQVSVSLALRRAGFTTDPGDEDRSELIGSYCIDSPSMASSR